MIPVHNLAHQRSLWGGKMEGNIPLLPTPISPTLGQKVLFHLSLNIFTNALIDIQHSSNTIFNSNHHGNRFSFHIIETREFNSCLIHKYHDKPTSECCHLDIALMLKCEYVPNISRYTCCRIRLTFLSMVPDIGLFSVCPLWF